MTAPARHLADIRAGHLAAIWEAGAAIDRAYEDAAAAARSRRTLIAELLAAGMSQHQIAREVGLSQARISQIMAED